MVARNDNLFQCGLGSSASTVSSATARAPSTSAQLARTAGLFAPTRSFLTSRAVSFISDPNFLPGVRNTGRGRDCLASRRPTVARRQRPALGRLQPGQGLSAAAEPRVSCASRRAKPAAPEQRRGQRGALVAATPASRRRQFGGRAGKQRKRPPGRRASASRCAAASGLRRRRSTRSCEPGQPARLRSAGSDGPTVQLLGEPSAVELLATTSSSRNVASKGLQNVCDTDVALACCFLRRDPCTLE